MNLTIRFLGTEVLHVSTTPDEQQQVFGDATATAVGVGFTNPYQGHGNEEDR